MKIRALGLGLITGAVLLFSGCCNTCSQQQVSVRPVVVKPAVEKKVVVKKMIPAESVIYIDQPCGCDSCNECDKVVYTHCVNCCDCQ